MRPERFDELTRFLTRKGTRRRGLGLLAVGTLSRFALGHLTSAAQERIVEIDIQVLTKDQIRGDLSTAGRGIRFDLRYLDKLTALAITAATGQEVFAVEQSGDQIVTRIAGGRLTTSIPLAEAQTVLVVQLPTQSAIDDEAAADQATVVDASVAPGTPGALPKDGPRLPTDDSTAIFGQLSQALVVDGDTDAIDEFRSDEAYALLPDLSFALSAAGLTGLSYRPSLALHALGLAAATDLGIKPKEPGVSYRIKLPSMLRPELTIQDYFDLYDDGVIDCIPPGVDPDLIGDVDLCGGGDSCESHPNEDRGCYGMCGPTCECWDEICGDCCYHEFCASHDDIFGYCQDTGNPILCFWSTVGAPLSFVTFGGCDGWSSWDWPW